MPPPRTSRCSSRPAPPCHLQDNHCPQTPTLRSSSPTPRAPGARTAALITSVSCQDGSALGAAAAASSRWLYYCQGDALLSAFSSASLSETVLYTTTSLSSSSHTEDLGGSDAWLNNLTLARTPDWWHATLRTNQDSSASWPGPYAPAQATVATTPTYPLYPGEQFELQIYNYQSYASNVASPGFTVAYDPTVLETQKGCTGTRQCKSSSRAVIFRCPSKSLGWCDRRDLRVSRQAFAAYG